MPVYEKSTTRSSILIVDAVGQLILGYEKIGFLAAPRYSITKEEFESRISKLKTGELIRSYMIDQHKLV